MKKTVWLSLFACLCMAKMVSAIDQQIELINFYIDQENFEKTYIYPLKPYFFNPWDRNKKPREIREILYAIAHHKPLPELSFAYPQALKFLCPDNFLNALTTEGKNAYLSILGEYARLLKGEIEYEHQENYATANIPQVTRIELWTLLAAQVIFTPESVQETDASMINKLFDNTLFSVLCHDREEAALFDLLVPGGPLKLYIENSLMHRPTDLDMLTQALYLLNPDAPVWTPVQAKAAIGLQQLTEGKEHKKQSPKKVKVVQETSESLFPKPAIVVEQPGKEKKIEEIKTPESTIIKEIKKIDTVLKALEQKETKIEPEEQKKVTEEKTSDSEELSLEEAAKKIDSLTANIKDVEEPFGGGTNLFGEKEEEEITTEKSKTDKSPEEVKKEEEQKKVTSPVTETTIVPQEKVEVKTTGTTTSKKTEEAGTTKQPDIKTGEKEKVSTSKKTEEAKTTEQPGILGRLTQYFAPTKKETQKTEKKETEKKEEEKKEEEKKAKEQLEKEKIEKEQLEKEKKEEAEDEKIWDKNLDETIENIEFLS